MSKWEDLPITIQEYYGNRVIRTIDSWSSGQNQIVVKFHGRCHWWHYRNDAWVPASATPLHLIRIDERGPKERELTHRGSYLVDGHSLEDAWDAVLSARDPFYLAGFSKFHNGHCDLNYVAKLEYELTHLPAQE